VVQTGNAAGHTQHRAYPDDQAPALDAAVEAGKRGYRLLFLFKDFRRGLLFFAWLIAFLLFCTTLGGALLL